MNMKTKIKAKENKKTLVEEKALLEKKLKEINAFEEQEMENKFEDLIRIVKPELDAYKKLITFAKKGKVTVELSYDIELSLCDHNLSQSGRGNLGDIEADCCVHVKQPKGYNIVPFIHEDNFCNMGMDDYDSVATVDPDLKKHCNDFLRAKEKLIDKTIKTAKKLDLDENESLERVQEFV